MAEGFISVVLEQLTSIINKQERQLVKLGVVVKKEEVETLTRNFRAIQVVLKDAEERQVKDDSVRSWLDRLKDVSYEVEHVLDEWNTKFLLLPIEQEGGDAPVATMNNVSPCIPAPFFCSGQVSRVDFSIDFARKIQKLNETLAKIAHDGDVYKFQITKSGVIEQIERQKTTSFVDKTFGRVDEEQLLVNMLLSESSQEAGTTPAVISIVGMGGIGKTNLAQLAYNDERVKANFTKTIWVYVSDPFDEINIAKAIIAGLDGNFTSISNDLETFSQCIRKCLARQKFLLVLDDVWNQDNRKWEKLRLPLENGAIGSKIIVTTRKEEVAMMMGALDKMINLKVLSDENCWLLFRHIALANRKQDECKGFEPIGKKIVKKCKGLPLVAKTLGGLMRYKKNEIENFYRCKMHDIVHDFLQFLTKDECFIAGVNGGEEIIELPADNKFCHLTITFVGEGPFPVSFNNCKSLRTITSFNCKINSLTLSPQLILQLKYVRTLILSDNRLKEVPKEVGGLVYLRCLDLSRNFRLKKLPDTLCNLVNLQTLRVIGCGSLEELPEDMGKLINLRHLHVQFCFNSKLPKTIGRLTSVETLDWVNIWCHDDAIDNNEEVFKLSDLRNMDHLKGTLLIKWNRNWNDAASDADKAKLVNKKHLRSLVLWFRHWTSGEYDP